MMDSILAFGLTLLVLALLGVWVPLLHAVETLPRRREARVVVEVPAMVMEPEMPSQLNTEAA